MANPRKTYRNKVSGAIGVYDVRLARRHPALEEVDADAKPLAYVPATPEQVADAIASVTALDADDETEDDESADEESED